MPDCDRCGDTFDTEHALHLHRREHWDDLSSHEREEVKDAEKTEERRQQQQQERIERRRKRLGYGLAAVLIVGLVAVVAAQTIDFAVDNPVDAVGATNLSGQPMLGDPDAPVTVVVFEDYRCPYCRQFEQAVKPRLLDEFVETGRASLHFVNFPFLGPGATQAAVAGECVYDRDPDGFWQFHRALFDAQGPESQRWVTTDLLTGLAANHTDADPDAVRACIQDASTRDAVQQDRRLAEAFGVSSTPSVYVNGERVEDWRYPSLAEVIERHE